MTDDVTRGSALTNDGTPAEPEFDPAVCPACSCDIGRLEVLTRIEPFHVGHEPGDGELGDDCGGECGVRRVRLDGQRVVVGVPAYPPADCVCRCHEAWRMVNGRPGSLRSVA